MPVVVDLDVMPATRKVHSKESVEAIGNTEANLSLLKSGKVKGVRFATLAAVCYHLRCEPGDILAYERAEKRPPRRGLIETLTRTDQDKSLAQSPTHA